MILETFRERETETYTLRDTRKCVEKDVSQNAEEKGGRTVLETKVYVRERKKESEVAQSCLTLCDPVDCSLPGSSVHGILHARILEWVAISFSRGSSRPRDRTQVSHIAGRRSNL